MKISKLFGNFRSNQENAVDRTSFVLIFAYICLTLPSALVVSIIPMPPNFDWPGLHIIAYILFWATSSVNPFIYVFTNKYYKNALMKTFGKRRNQNTFEETHGSTTFGIQSTLKKISFKRTTSETRFKNVPI